MCRNTGPATANKGNNDQKTQTAHVLPELWSPSKVIKFLSPECAVKSLSLWCLLTKVSSLACPAPSRTKGAEN